MSDDASKTLGGGVRAFLGTAGFLLMMFGGYHIYEHNNLRLGIPMVAGGLPLFILPWAWDRLTARFRSSSAPKKAIEPLPFVAVIQTEKPDLRLAMPGGDIFITDSLNEYTTGIALDVSVWNVGGPSRLLNLASR